MFCMAWVFNHWTRGPGEEGGGVFVPTGAIDCRWPPRVPLFFLPKAGRFILFYLFDRSLGLVRPIVSYSLLCSAIALGGVARGGLCLPDDAQMVVFQNVLFNTI